MAETTHIEWTDATWNVITGCSVLSAGCRRCYAMRLAGTRLRNHPSRAGLTVDTKAGPVWTGEVRFNKQWAHQPLDWRKPRMIFVCAHADLFHKDVPDAWIDHVFAVASLCPQHTFQILTKRASRMREYFAQPNVWARIEVAARVIHKERTGEIIAGKILIGPLRNCWLGVSAEDQENADERIHHLLLTPAALHWVSLEPLLGAIDLTNLPIPPDALLPRYGTSHGFKFNALREDSEKMFNTERHLAWVVMGGESQADARPCHPKWLREIRDQCAEAGVPLVFKQWGTWIGSMCNAFSDDTFEAVRKAQQHDWPDGFQSFKCGKKVSGRTLDGVIHDAFPEVK